MLALVIPVGLLIGLSLGALGGGGSILAVPALVYLFGQSSHAATTGSLLIVGTTSLVGALPHRRAGRVSLAKGAVFGILGILGSYIGSRFSTAVPQDVLLAAFSVLILFVAVLMIRRQRRKPARGGQPAVDPALADAPVITFRPEFTCDCRRAVRIVLTATTVGLLTGFFGVGGGFAVVPALVLALGLSMPVAVGTSLLVIGINSVTALAFRLDQGLDLDWTVIGLFTLSAVLGGLAGNRVVSRVNPARLSQAFAILLVAVALYTAARSIPHLF
ncbi:sulfite exporter TauE/SafE family protein [Cellulomonas sp. P24]|uniref:sulfite exporter TauE/SafE family protein n=1 Tax=Cellulomonas sp. P24 TaxID=2885206 RepID=UPI00216AFE16|nr:sulfite exporter TauE/SafE family protein [Cellulomonas sp. P24]MCR6494328.1 sulfite exporter TauE/SafE family protein [Cellulomonas sp. P24]